MNERVRLIGGRLLIKSQPMRGTEILAEVPLRSSVSRPRAKTVAAGGRES
jgi:signal transduction histidine kinase